MRRIAIFCGFLVAAIVFAWHVSCGNDLVYCAWMALVVQFAATSVILFAMKWIGKILMDHLRFQREELERQAEERAAQLGVNPAAHSPQGSNE